MMGTMIVNDECLENEEMSARKIQEAECRTNKQNSSASKRKKN